MLLCSEFCENELCIYTQPQSGLRLDCTVQSNYFWDWTGLRSQRARPYSPVFLSVSILKLETGSFFSERTVFFGPNCGPSSPDRVVRAFGTVSKKSYGPDRTGLWPVYRGLCQHTMRQFFVDYSTYCIVIAMVTIVL
jgi:hypothetical protein